LTERGEATLQKTDIFRKIMWFGYRDENTWYPINVERVNHILQQNREGKKPATLEKDFEVQAISTGPINNDLAQLDRKFRNKSGKKKKKNRGRSNPHGPGNRPQGPNNPPAANA
jgi:hypothetical protein